MLRAMGFSAIATTVAGVLPAVIEAETAREHEKYLRRTADEQEKLAAQQAAAVEGTASANQMRGSRNAHMQLGRVRVDAAASNTAQEGSTYKRGVDMATRLQDEISAAANEQLERANQMRRQAAYDAWDTRNQARQSRLNAIGAAASGLGSLLGGIAGGLSGGKEGDKGKK